MLSRQEKVVLPICRKRDAWGKTHRHLTCHFWQYLLVIVTTACHIVNRKICNYALSFSRYTLSFVLFWILHIIHWVLLNMPSIYLQQSIINAYAWYCVGGCHAISLLHVPIQCIGGSCHPYGCGLWNSLLGWITEAVHVMCCGVVHACQVCMLLN